MLKNETKLENRGIDTRIAANLRRLRIEKGLTTAHLGRLCGIPWISRIEAGAKPVGKRGLMRLAKCLDVDISEFYLPEYHNQARTEQLLQVFKTLTTEGQALLIEQAKAIAVYERRLKWRE